MYLVGGIFSNLGLFRCLCYLHLQLKSKLAFRLLFLPFTDASKLQNWKCFLFVALWVCVHLCTSWCLIKFSAVHNATSKFIMKCQPEPKVLADSGIYVNFQSLWKEEKGYY